MLEFFSHLSPICQSFIAGSVTFFVTALGASIVFFFKKINKNILDTMLSISSGIMLSASFFSLLQPAIDMSICFHLTVYFVISFGFLLGGFFLFLGDKVIDYFSKHNKNKISKFKRCIMLFSSITLHNIPEGLVIGVAFGVIPYVDNRTGLLAAIALTLGIAIQNFPEGSAISFPLRRDGFSRKMSFLFGAISGLVEPIAAVLGAILVLKIQIILPFILSFAAGAMIFVITMELIPESQTNKRKDLMALFLMFGFSVMMILELTLG